jgi:hypothetical protein
MESCRYETIEGGDLKRRFSLLALAAVVSGAVAVWLSASPAGASSQGRSGRSIPASGLTSIQGGYLGSDGAVQWPEFPGSTDNSAGGPAPFSGVIGTYALRRQGFDLRPA